MIKESEVKRFLKDFFSKMQIWDIYFRSDRNKNSNTLAELELTGRDQKKIIEDLKPEDYCEGPKEDTLNKGTDQWVFGKLVKGRDVYIKITLGNPGKPVICISFHIAEYPLVYPLKD